MKICYESNLIFQVPAIFDHILKSKVVDGHRSVTLIHNYIVSLLELAHECRTLPRANLVTLHVAAVEDVRQREKSRLCCTIRNWA